MHRFTRKRRYRGGSGKGEKIKLFIDTSGFGNHNYDTTTPEASARDFDRNVRRAKPDTRKYRCIRNTYNALNECRHNQEMEEYTGGRNAFKSRKLRCYSSRRRRR